MFKSKNKVRKPRASEVMNDLETLSSEELRRKYGTTAKGDLSNNSTVINIAASRGFFM
jgi:hypothetical protein